MPTRWPSPTDTVRAEDGVPLHVEYDGPPDADVTVVFSHGYTESSAEFYPQRAALRDRARLVLWDQRGHGRSGWTRLTRATIDQTGRDLASVLDAVAPHGPVVLVGHSMGGMSSMALARRRPELFGSRVAGVALIATSAGGLVRAGVVGTVIRLLRALHLLTLWLRWLELIAPLLQRLRRPGTRAGRWFTRRYLFGRDDADPALVSQVQGWLEATPAPVTAAFYATFLDHDEEAALPVLARVPVLVVAAENDQLTPAAHGRRMAELLAADGPAELGGHGAAGTELIVVPGARHSVNITRPEIVNRALIDLLDRVAALQRESGAA